MLETTDQVRERLLEQAKERWTKRIASATTLGASDAALRDLQWDNRRIKSMTEQQLLERAVEIEPERERGSVPRG